jgi:hypothetical protein
MPCPPHCTAEEGALHTAPHVWRVKDSIPRLAPRQSPSMTLGERGRAESMNARIILILLLIICALPGHQDDT